MNKREAMKAAHRAAFRLLQNGIDNADVHEWAEDIAKDAGDVERITEAFDELVQRHFEAGRR